MSLLPERSGSATQVSTRAIVGRSLRFGHAIEVRRLGFLMPK
jgi:hypothetical protein